MSSFSVFAGFKNTLTGIIPPAYEDLITGQDLVIKFLSAEVCLHKYIFNISFSFFFLEFTKNGFHR
jgi:hypothetical protein